MTDLDALKTFTTAVRAGSFAAAARVLGLTPAMVGRRIQNLEQQFGTRLIERTTRVQRLTESGETFLARAETVGTYRLIVIAAPAYLSRHGTPTHPAELASARCLINLNMSPRNRWPFSRAGVREIAEVSGGLQIDNGEALRAAVLEGAGIA